MTHYDDLIKLAEAAIEAEELLPTIDAEDEDGWLQTEAIVHDFARACIPAKILSLAKRMKELEEALNAGIHAADLALFVIRKQNVMPNSSWESGFNKDLAIARAALTTPAKVTDYKVSFADQDFHDAEGSDATPVKGVKDGVFNDTKERAERMMPGVFKK